MRRRSSDPTGLSQKGQATFLVLFSVSALFLAGGVALDAAQVFQKKLQLQNALDAAAIAGIDNFREEGDAAAASEAAKKLFNYNLDLAKIPVEGRKITANITPSAKSIHVDGEITVPTFFMSFLPGFKEFTIKGNASGKFTPPKSRPIAVFIGFDLSGSVRSSIPDFKKAAKKFIEKMTENFDYLGIGVFKFRSTDVLYPFQKINKSSAISALAGMDDYTCDMCGGNSAALSTALLARTELETKAPADAVKVIILFGDAQWTEQPVFTFLHRNDNPGIDTHGTGDPIPPLAENPPGSGHYEYRVGNGGLKNSVTNETTDCDIFSRCLSNFDYLDTRGNLRDLPDLDLKDSEMKDIIKREKDILRIILETDYAKDEGILIYTIGPFDFGTHEDSFYDKYRNVLRRLANVGTTPGTPFSDAETPDFPELPNKPAHPVGGYYEAPSSATFSSILSEIASTIQSLVLTE